MNPAVGPRLVPPRPNLGPEPWSDAQAVPRLLVVAAVLAAMLLVWMIARRIGRVRAGARPREQVVVHAYDDTPRGRLLAHSHSIRDLLTDHFGTAWRAKTTEELSAEPQLEAALGREQLEEMISFLDQVDHLKFAPVRSNHHHELLESELAVWEPRIADLKKTIQAQARV